MSLLKRKFTELFFLLIITLFCSCKSKKTSKQFANKDFSKVVAYKMNGKYGEVIEKRKLSKNIIGNGEELTKFEGEKLIQILNDKSTYGGIPAKCFEPHIGYIFYDNKDEIIGYLTICLECNWMITNPDIGGVFSRKGNKRLNKLGKVIFNE